MEFPYTVGDLVHIPQAVCLVDCDNDLAADPQLTIPYRVRETEEPCLGVVTGVSQSGYLHVFCDGSHWAVAGINVYRIDRSPQPMTFN